MRRWGVHSCLLDKDCREVRAGWRVSAWTPWFTVGMAFRPQDRFVQTDKKAWREDREVVFRRSTWLNFQRAPRGWKG